MAATAFDAEHRYSDVVHFVHVQVIEPHPAAPDPSPYVGIPREKEYSLVRQHRTWEDRVLVARETRKLLAGDQTLLVDDLSPGGLVNPVWHTYGRNPNGTILVGRDGRVAYSHLWTEVEEVRDAIDALLGGG